MARWSSGLRLRPLTPATAVRIRYGSPFFKNYMYVSVKNAEHKVGVNDHEGPPVPIPNTEVKLMSVESTWVATPWEDRTMPTLFYKKSPSEILYIE